jgi:hypothetical protein
MFHDADDDGDGFVKASNEEKANIIILIYTSIYSGTDGVLQHAAVTEELYMQKLWIYKHGPHITS